MSEDGVGASVIPLFIVSISANGLSSEELFGFIGGIGAVFLLEMLPKSFMPLKSIENIVSFFCYIFHSPWFGLEYCYFFGESTLGGPTNFFISIGPEAPPLKLLSFFLS